MIREILLFCFTCLGALLLGKYALFNFRSLAVAHLHQEEDIPSERRHALLAAGLLLVLFTLISMLFGISLFFVKITALIIFFISGLLLAIQSDILLFEKSEELYRKREEARIRGEFFFWLGVVTLVFVLSIFVFV